MVVVALGAAVEELVAAAAVAAGEPWAPADAATHLAAAAAVAAVGVAVVRSANLAGAAGFAQSSAATAAASERFDVGTVANCLCPLAGLPDRLVHAAAEAAHCIVRCCSL